MKQKPLITQSLDMYEKINELKDLNKKDFYLIGLTAKDAMNDSEHAKFAQISIHERSIRIKNRQEQIDSLCKEVEELDRDIYCAL